MKQERARILGAWCALAWLAGCGLPGAPQPPSLELPKPVHDLKFERRGSQVTLSWSAPRDTTDHQRVRHAGPTRICRAIEALWTPAVPAAPTACTPLTDVPPPAASGGRTPVRALYVDTLPDSLQADHAMGAAIYTVEALNPGGHSAGPSNAVRVPLAPTLAPPQKLFSQLTAEGPVISWVIPLDQLGRVLQPEAARQRAPLAYGYRLYRLDKARPRAGTVTIPVDHGFASPRMEQPNDNVLDSSAEWERTYEYRVAVVTTLNANGVSVEIEGELSPPVEVVNHDTFPPPPPAGVQAVFTEAGEQRFVDVTWLPSEARDVAGYQVYRREEGAEPQKLTSELARTPAFRDSNVTAGRRYFYSVSATDTHGNESARSAEASERVPEKP